MYELYSANSGLKLLNLSNVSYNVNVQTQRYNHGGSSWVEPTGRRFSDLRLEGPCDPLAGGFFYRLSLLNMNDNPLSDFYISDDSINYTIGVSGAIINSWQYSDSEHVGADVFSLVFSVENIRRLTIPISEDAKKIQNTKKRVKEKKIVLPERQIVICRTH